MSRTAFENLDAHLAHPQSVDKDGYAVVHRYASNARAWNTVLRVISEELRCPLSHTLNLGVMLRCIDVCRNEDAPPPPFLVDFEEILLQTWAGEMVAELGAKRSTAWDVLAKLQLVAALRWSISRRLCHERHRAAIDFGRNPSALSEYVRCILYIWEESDGEANPTTTQCLRNLSTCSAECIQLICDYTALGVLNERQQQCNQLATELCKMHRIICTAFTSTGLSNASAFGCITAIRFSSETFALLKRTEQTLCRAWELLTNQAYGGDQFVVLPGLKGSHVERFAVPAFVVSRPMATINCIRSSLAMSLSHPPVDHDVMISSDHWLVQTLPNEVRTCAHRMIRAERFGGEFGCELAWWNVYIELTKSVASEICTRLHLPMVDDSLATTESSSTFTTETSDMVNVICELRVRRALYNKSSVSKVCIAGNLFDATARIALTSGDNIVLKARDISSFFNVETGTMKNDVATAGKVFSDMKNVVDHLKIEFSTSAIFDVKEKTIMYKTPTSAMRTLHLLIQYMEEMSKSRRKRKDPSLVRRNTRPLYDARKRSSRPSTPGSCTDVTLSIQL